MYRYTYIHNTYTCIHIYTYTYQYITFYIGYVELSSEWREYPNVAKISIVQVNIIFPTEGVSSYCKLVVLVQDGFHMHFAMLLHVFPLLPAFFGRDMFI